jgi:hypothetical protein
MPSLRLSADDDQLVVSEWLVAREAMGQGNGNTDGCVSELDHVHVVMSLVAVVTIAMVTAVQLFILPIRSSSSSSSVPDASDDHMLSWLRPQPANHSICTM